MAKQKKGEGFHSAAGLIRYFDAEEKTALKIPFLLIINNPIINGRRLAENIPNLLTDPIVLKEVILAKSKGRPIDK